MSGWQNKGEFKARVLEWAQKLDVRVQSLAVRPMKNKWASCSTNGNLNFNIELLELDRELGDYRSQRWLQSQASKALFNLFSSRS